MTLLMAYTEAIASADATIRVVRRGSQPSTIGSPEHFTLSVRIDHPFKADAPGRTVGSFMTFEPGARSAWHTHPAGQWILVTSGKALVGEIDGPIEEALPGDSVWFPPNVQNWIGAAPNTAATLLTVGESNNVNWLKKVTDAEYGLSATQSGGAFKHIEIIRAGSRPSGLAAARNFTGAARTDWIFPVKDGNKFYGAYVTFDPAARTNWHTHINGQSILVTKGRGFFQQEGQVAIEVREGDFVWIPAGVNHYHAAPPDTLFVTISMSENPEVGSSTDWGAPVTDEHYVAAIGEPLKTLSAKQTKIPLIAAFTASGDIERLKGVLVEGLEAGLTVNETKEILAHLYAYTGFPRSLNANLAFIDVMEERQSKGVEDVMGNVASPVVFDNGKYQYGVDVLAELRKTTGPVSPSRVEVFNPVIEVFLKEHLFADLFARDNLDYLSRELAVVGALFNIRGTNAQLRSHITICLNLGVSDDQMRSLLAGMAMYLGKERSDNALGVLQLIIDSRK
jgi:quercetin dioxygenase-like cupin family protein/glutaredoxin